MRRKKTVFKQMYLNRKTSLTGLRNTTYDTPNRNSRGTLFLFSCWTGYLLRHEGPDSRQSGESGMNGSLWIHKERRRTVDARM
ncbi:hypothetical protein [Bacteroides acidifaciens]|uniref:hypothetical protein n=1 Tax=Bacteroides acidifaciens TaxID=85831 RepID=UPI003F691D75